jgi:hypothetical protein
MIHGTRRIPSAYLWHIFRSLVERWDRIRKITSSDRFERESERGSEYEVFALFEGFSVKSLKSALRFPIAVVLASEYVASCKKY